MISGSSVMAAPVWVIVNQAIISSFYFDNYQHMHILINCMFLLFSLKNYIFCLAWPPSKHSWTFVDKIKLYENNNSKQISAGVSRKLPSPIHKPGFRSQGFIITLSCDLDKLHLLHKLCWFDLTLSSHDWTVWVYMHYIVHVVPAQIMQLLEWGALS